MNLDEYHDHIQAAFDTQKQKATDYVERFNAALPLECSWCHGRQVPGLPCPELDCGYCHPVSYMLVVPGEFGFEVRPINHQRRVVCRFDVEGV